MKKMFLPALAFLLMAFGLNFEGLTDAEREFALRELTDSQEHLNTTIKGLSAAQFNFKPDEGSWSIAECLDHITISEDMIPGMLKGALEVPADPSRRSEVKFSDEALLDIIKSREQKVKTSEPFKPSGKYGTIDETL
ncbi:MAG: DinB family protein, partial [Flavobacteriaceae bacterium]